MYSIGEISKMFQLPISTLRYYDKEGLFPHLKRVNGVRQFSESEIETLRVIDCLKKSGLEIKEIKEYMSLCSLGNTTLKQRKEIFEKQKEEVLQEAFLDALNEMLANSNDYLNRLTANLEVAIKHNSTDEKLAEKMKVLQQDLLDRTERRENYDDVATEILRIRELQEQSNMDSVTKAEHKKRIQELQRFIKSQPTAVTKFDESLAKNLLSQIIIHDDFLEFKFKSGVTVSIEK